MIIDGILAVPYGGKTSSPRLTTLLGPSFIRLWLTLTMSSPVPLLLPGLMYHLAIRVPPKEEGGACQQINAKVWDHFGDWSVTEKNLGPCDAAQDHPSQGGL